MKHAMKKIVAAVLMLAMLLGITTVAFAEPDFSLRNPNEPVSLRVHHTRPMDPENESASPGWPNPNVGIDPPIEGAPVVGAHWFAVRLTVAQGGVVNPADLAAAFNYVSNFNFATGLPTVGTLPTGWAITSGRVGAVITDNNGLAYFTNDALVAQLGTNIPGGAANCTNDRGQGTWLVWEQYSGAATCPHTGSNALEGYVTTIHRPFLVNLPTWVTYGDHGDYHWGDGAAPGYWVYRVNVFPKPSNQIPLEKEPGTAVPGIDADGNFITTLGWRMSAGIPADIAATNADNVLGVNELFFPVQNPNLPASLVGNGPIALTAGTHPTTSYIVMRDILDYRVRLVDGSMTVRLFNTVTNTYSNIDSDAWALRTAIIPGTGTPALTVNFDGMQSGGAAIPNLTMTASGLGVQVFWLHFTDLEEIINAVGAANWGNIGDFMLVANFEVVTNNLTIEQLPVIDNTFEFVPGRNPGSYSGDHDRGTGRHRLFGIQIEKRNLIDGALLDGAEFRLWHESQMTGNAGDTDRQPAISNPSAPAADQVRYPHIRSTITGPGSPDPHPATSPMFGQTTGIGWILDLPAGVYYLQEFAAPTGYSALPGWRRIVVNADTATMTAMRPGEHDTPCVNPGDCTGCLPRFNGHQLTCASDTCTGCMPVMLKSILFTNDRTIPQLPLTGGAGTLMFTAAGVSLMGGAGLFLFLARKKDKVKDR